MRFYWLYFCLVAAGSAAQQHTLFFTDSLYAEENLAHSFAFLEHVKGNNVEGHFIGSLSITYPENFNHQDTAFTHEFFVGYEGQVKRGIAILIGDYNSSAPTLYIDYNNNLDFRDDGPPTVFKNSSAYITLSAKAPHNGKFSIRYTIPKPDSASVHFLNKTFNVDSQATHGLMSAEYWYDSKRHNNKLTKTLLDGDSVKVVLHDYNVNGNFDDIGSDLIFFNQPIIPFDAFPTSGCIKLDTNTTLFSFKNKTYKVVEIEPTGRYITIEETDLPYKKPLGPGDVMPNLTLATPSGDSLKLVDMLDGEHYLMINMWANWCKPCHNSAPKLKEFADKHSEKIKVLGVSPHNVNNAIEKFTAQYNHDWLQALNSKEFMQVFLAEEYPRYILIDPKGIIISLRTFPHEVEDKLK